MREQTKAAIRRAKDWHYTNRYFVGDGIDIGAGPDPLSKLRHVYPLMGTVRDWDLADGDAQTLPGIDAESLDFVSASHVLEHLDNPFAAFRTWLDVLKPNGHLIITVPDWDMYERCRWPSIHSGEHKWAFTLDPRWCGQEQLIWMHDLLFREPASGDPLWGIRCERLIAIGQFFDPSQPPEIDQTLGPAECAIELVLKKL